MRLPAYKPVPVPLRAAVIPLGRPLLDGSSDLPGSSQGRAVPPPLFGLAPRGVCNAGGITSAAVRSYRTISPLPRHANPKVHPSRRYIFCCTFRQALGGPARPLAGTLPCGDRTFLSREPDAERRDRQRLPIRQPHGYIVAWTVPPDYSPPKCAARHAITVVVGLKSCPPQECSVVSCF